jgi:hypothetical protein
MTEIVGFAPVIDPWLIFVGKACAEMGIDFRLITLTPDGNISDGDAQDCWKWLSKNKSFRIEVVNTSELETVCGETCFVLLRGNYQPRERTLIRRLIKNFSRSVALLRFAKQSLRWQAKQIIKEITDPFYCLFTEVWTEDISIGMMCAILNKTHRYYGILPHQRSSLLEECCILLEDDIPLGDRPCLFSYAGTANNYRRDIAASWIKSRLSADSELIHLGPIGGTHRVIWHYDQDGSHRPRPYDIYIKEIESSWFSLCLPGVTGTTNRVLEAILRGSIPVIPAEQARFYCLPFQDRINSIFVLNNDWEEAINIIAAMTYAKRLAMQQAVVELSQSQASLNAISNRLVCNILGKTILA